jgi:hypothetical protein
LWTEKNKEGSASTMTTTNHKYDKVVAYMSRERRDYLNTLTLSQMLNEAIPWLDTADSMSKRLFKGPLRKEIAQLKKDAKKIAKTISKMLSEMDTGTT